MPIFTENGLEPMSVKDLKALCKKWGVSIGATKRVIIDNILARVATLYGDNSDFEKKKRELRSSSLPNPSPLHKGYANFFNLIELADRTFYSVDENHPHRS